MAQYDQVDLLSRAILALGKQEAEKTLRQAQKQAARLVAEEKARAEAQRRQTTAAVQAQAHLEARNRIDRAELESKRRVVQAKETLLEEIFQQGLEQLQAFRHTPEYPDWLQRMLTATLVQLEGEQFQVVAHPEEYRWLTPELLAAVSRETGRQLNPEPDPELAPGGFMVIRADGRVRYDQTFQGILKRRRETLRSELARRLWGS